MWKISLKHISRVLLCACLLFLPPFSLQAEETTEYITLTVQEWNEFKMDWTEQMNDLTELEMNLIALKTESAEQQKQVEKLLKKCSGLEMELKETERSLTSAKVSLTEAKKEIFDSKIALNELKKETDDLKHKIRLAKRQRDAWAMGVPLAFMLGIAVNK